MAKMRRFSMCFHEINILCKYMQTMALFRLGFILDTQSPRP
jgi:hypothetical protein